MRVVSFSEARKHLKSVLDTVNDDANATIVTRRDADDKAGKTVTRELIDTSENSDKSDGRSDDNEHTDSDIESA